MTMNARTDSTKGADPCDPSSGVPVKNSIAPYLPRVLCARLRITVARAPIPESAAAQQWRATIKAGMVQLAPGGVDALFQPEQLRRTAAPLSGEATALGLERSNTTTPGFSLHVSIQQRQSSSHESLYLTFFENASAYLPLVLQAVLLRHHAGIGAGAARFEVEAMELYHPTRGWHRTAAVTGNADAAGWLFNISTTNESYPVRPARFERAAFALRFLSRTILVEKGKSVHELRQWSQIGESVLRRVTQIRDIWGGPASSESQREWSSAMEVARRHGASIKLLESTARPNYGTITSRRQHGKYASDGLVGFSHWECSQEALTCWSPLLQFAEVAQLGQQTTVGMGQLQFFPRGVR